MNYVRGVARGNSVVRAALFICLFCLFGFSFWLGLAPDIKLEMLASTRAKKWDNFWKKSDSLPNLSFSGDLLPVNIPGPSDKWAGGKPHSVDVSFSIKPGRYHIKLVFFDSHEGSPPKLSFSLNNKFAGEYQVKRGEGKPSPYKDEKPDLTISVPLDVTSEQNSLRITNVSGSWVAPAKMRLVDGKTFNPAKAAFLVLDSGWYLGLATILLMSAMLFMIMGKERGVTVVATALLMFFSVSFAFVLSEFLFRVYLVKAPQARRLSANVQNRDTDFKGKGYSYGTMIQPNPDPRIIYTLKPNLDGHFAEHPLKTNSRFMRGPEVSETKNEGTLRIVGLGDSLMFGWGVAYEETSLMLVGKMLEEKLGREMETLNFACPSYNMDVEVASYQKMAHRYDPDLAIMLVVGNDFGVPGIMLEPVRLYTLRKSYIKEQLRRRLAAYWKDAPPESDPMISTRHTNPVMGKSDDKITSRERWLKDVYNHFNSVSGELAMRAYLSEFSEMLKEDNIPGIIVYAPVSSDVTEPEPHTELVMSIAKSVGLGAIDMTPVYRNYLRKVNKTMKEGIWVNDRDWHPNKTGHALIAGEIVRYILEKNYLIGPNNSQATNSFAGGLYADVK